MNKKTKSGRKPLYSEPEKMQEAINAYFDWCAGRWLVDQNGKEILDDKGRPILVDAHPPTITGLSLALGFSSRKGLFDYQRKPQFRDIVTVAKSRVEQYAEESLFNPDRLTGAKFTLLCNFGWAQDHSNESLPVRTARVVIVNT